MALIDDYKTRFPEFEDALVDTWIPILEPVYPAYYALEYSDTTQEATLNLLAHLLTMETSNGSTAGQQVASKSVGSVSISYVAPNAVGGELSDFMRGTKYGQRFLIITASRYGGCAV